MKAFSLNHKKHFLFLNILILSFLTRSHAQQVYPSAGAFWVGSAGNYVPTDSATLAQGLRTYDDVISWEAHHADFGAWIQAPYRNYVNNFVLLDYMYTGAISLDGYLAWEPNLHWEAISNGHNWENFFLHYKQDTWLNYTTLYQNNAVWAGVPSGVGYTLSSGDRTGIILPGTGPWSPAADIFQGLSQGGAFYLVNPEKFAEATLTFATGGTHGTITVQYASAVGSNLQITQWTTLALNSDSTSNFSHSGRISWIPPANWVWGFDTVPKGIAHPYGHWLKITGTGYTQRPLLTNLYTRAWFHLAATYFLGGRMNTMLPPNFYIKNLGWDSINDLNHDGYLEDNEYNHLVDPNATARFRYESRLNINNIIFPSNTSFSWTNTANPQYQQDVAEYYHNAWGANGMNGAYNDNFYSDMNPSYNPVLAGGELINEGTINGLAQDTSAELNYNRGFNAVLKGVQHSTGSSWIGANIVDVNPYDWHPFDEPSPEIGKDMLSSKAYNWFIMEAITYDNWSIVDNPAFYSNTGLSRLWHIPAFAAAGIKSALMTKVGPNLFTPPSTKVLWERSQSALLAQYYLFHFTNLTSFQLAYWNITDISQLTTTANYYKSGVPSNYAYQPHDMLGVNIGTPTGSIPLHGSGSYNPMQYTAAVDSADQNKHTIIGTASSTVLNHPVYGPIPVLPTATYYLWSTPTAPYTTIVYDPQGQAFPAEVALARQFTKGMVILRVPFSVPTNYQNYASDANEITVTLPGSYYKVNYDGTLGPLSNQVTLHGFEGAVFTTEAPGGASLSTGINNQFTNDLSNPMITAYPNPCSTQNQETQINFSQIHAGSVLKIFSMSTGRLIKTMLNLNGTTSWDLTNDSEENVASGIYIYAITDQQNNTSRGKLCVIR